MCSCSCLVPKGTSPQKQNQFDLDYLSLFFHFSLPFFNCFKNYAKSPRLSRKPRNPDFDSELPKKNMLGPKVIS